MSPIAIPSPTIKDGRPSPWHDIAHSLSYSSPSPQTVPLSSSALREWDRALAGEARRHSLVHPSATPTPPLRHAMSNSSISVLSLGSNPTPKLAAERDKEGHIEYKLKLIDPTPERFDRLVTQMLWRLKQGRNEAIYELGLADDGTVVGLTRAEMDASVHTLELMASEVGATVIILKEIVLVGNLPETYRRPDLGADGLPRANVHGGKRTRRHRRRDRESDPLFHLELDKPKAKTKRSQQPSRSTSLKAAKAAERREKRRLDLIRGDGMGPEWTEPSTPPACIPQPHQPARPSMLRLATAPTSSSPTDPFLEELLRIPMDNLSLSFAEVQTVTDPADLYRPDSSSSSESEGEAEDETMKGSDTNDCPSPDGSELICVEALVVRKTAEGVAGVDEWCEDGEDAWGFGCGDDDEEDAWGL